MTTRMSRRTFAACITAYAPGVGLAGMTVAVRAAGDISHTAESIHQEVLIQAAATRIYDVLTDARQFTKLTTFSPVKNAAPARIGRAAGDTFSLFGGHIIGRHLELVPAQRIVQAWRVVDWAPGIYSIAKFDLIDQGSQTTISFDHTGFPNGKAEHLAEGWKLNYWEPLKKYLA